MSDIYCSVCNEPWDIYGLSHGDVKAWEADAIRSGHGCPCCISNGKQPTDNYKEPEPRIIARCPYCQCDITIDQDNIWYNGKEIEYDEELVSRLPNNQIVCDSCKESLYECEECGKYVDDDDSIYIQDLNVCLCSDCNEELVTNCPHCGQSYWNTEEHDCCCKNKENE